MFVLSLKYGDNDPTRNPFDEYYIPLVVIKDFNALIDNNPFFDQPRSKQEANKQEANEKLIKMSRNNDYTTGIYLDFSHHHNYYKLIDIDLSRKTNISISHQIKFTWKLEDDLVKKKFIAKK